MLKSRLLSMVNPQIFFRWFFLNDYNVTCKVAKVIHITKSHNIIFFWIQHQEVMTKPLFIVRNSIWRLSMTLPKVFSQGNCPLLLAKLLNVEFLAKNLFYKNVKNCERGREGGYQSRYIVGHHRWPTKKIFHFKSSKTARKNVIFVGGR